MTPWGTLRLFSTMNFSTPSEKSITTRTQAIVLMVCVICGLGLAGPVRAAEAAAQSSPPAFEGDKTLWHGFDRYDFVMDEDSLAITPTKAQPDEGNGIKHQVQGRRRCILVVPKQAASGNPWSWRGVYWDHQPQTEVELLRRGFCIAYIESSETLKPDKSWDAWYEFLTEQHGLSKKPAFVGMSRGGEYSYIWATKHPDQVSCIYADNPGGNWDVMMRIAALATNDVPLLHVCGSIDPILGKFTLPIESMYQQFGGRISVLIKEGYGHHPHGLTDPKPIADFIVQSVYETKTAPPDFAVDNTKNWTKSHYYSVASSYQYLPGQKTYVTLRGPLFTECYDRYQIQLANVEAFTTIIAPKKPAPGNPWVFRADVVDRDAVVDQALLAKGFYIVTGAVPYNGDGPDVKQWNTIYQHLTDHGFSKKPVMEGDGGAAGEAYAWAIANPDKISCIYAENPVMHSNTAKTQPLDSLAPLAKAGVPLLHVCGSLDPWFKDNTLMLEKRYKKLGGKIIVIVKKGEGHYPLAPEDPNPVVDFITKSVQ